MTSAITEGVKVSVRATYQSGYSSPSQSHFVFLYEVTIENNSEYTLQLLRRHWYIYDSIGEIREVEGEGVIGKQPVIEPGMSHKYMSGCNLKTNIGKMRGTYLMERQIDGKVFEVEIPEFTLVPDYILN